MKDAHKRGHACRKREAARPSLDSTRLLNDRHRFFRPPSVALVRPSHSGTHTRVSLPVCARVHPSTSAVVWIGARQASAPRHTQECLDGRVFFFFLPGFPCGLQSGCRVFLPLGPLCILGDLSKKHFDSAGPFLFKLHCDLSAGATTAPAQSKHTRGQEHTLTHLTRSTTEQSLYVMQ